MAMKDLKEYREEIFRRADARLKKRKTVRRRVLFVCLPLLLCGVIVGSVLLRPYLTGRNVIDTPKTDAWASARLISVRSAGEGLSPTEIVDLTVGVQKGSRTVPVDLTAGNAAAVDFAVRLLRATADGQDNALVAPLSVLTALGMIANGAAGETKAQTAAVLGMSVEEWNDYLAAVRTMLASANDVTLDVFNSLWIDGRDDFAVDADFLQVNADCYGADVFFVPEECSMAEAINTWVNGKTDGRIERMANEADGRMWMALVSTLFFEADWTEEWSSVEEGSFTCADGSVKTVDMMVSRSAERVASADGSVAGFVRYYGDGAYAFMALTPTGNTYRSVQELLAVLTGEALSAIWQSRGQPSDAFTVFMPKFSAASELLLKEALSTMGMSLAFDSAAADFSGVGRFGERDTHEISDVRQKTTLAADVNGTVGSDGTVIETGDDGQDILLNSPFLYVIVHVETGVPIFAGLMMDPTA